jgi:solute carrier family 25 (mitochondrial folate transporter), member 32
VFFTCFNQIKLQGLRRGYEDGPVLHVAAAVGAGLVTDVAVNPVWMIKLRLQTKAVANHPSRDYRNSADAFRKIVRDEGVRALYKGLVPQFFGLAHVAVQFPLYEQMKFRLREHKGSDHFTTLEIIAMSTVSKVVASVIAYPHEVLRARFQFQSDSNPRRYRSIRDACVRIAREEGMRGFYRGLTANILRVVPSAAVTITGYERLTEMLASRRLND